MKRNYSLILTDGTELDFKRIFDQYFNSLVLFANRYLTQQEDSESLVQDTFLALWENRLEFPNEISVKAYLYSTVRNKSLNILKHNKIKQQYIDNVLAEKDSELYYMTSVIEEETRRLIFNAIDELPEHSRRVCLLSLKGFNNQEIAEQLKISINTVKFHKKNIYSLLREKLQDYFYSLFIL